nr:PTS N-acetylglucosamine transporter subunit IIABC [Candidatus Pantoea persica]
MVGINGRYQAGFFPIMMFGLPGAALAIYHCARPENLAKVGGIMLAAVFAAFFHRHHRAAGILLYVRGAGLVDLALSSRNPLATHWWMLIPQGIVFFVIYYLVFHFTIKKFNLMTPGRELAVAGDESDGYDVNVDKTDDGESATESLARRYIGAVGGSDNLTGTASPVCAST